MSTAAKVAGHAATGRIREAEHPRFARVVQVERTRPVAAEAAGKVEAGVAVASGRKEEAVAVRCGEESSVHAVLVRPSNGRVLVKFLPFLFGRHAPVAAPVGRGSVVLGKEGGQVVGEAVVAVIGFVAVLGQRDTAAVAVLVGAPTVVAFWLRLAPGEVVAIVLGTAGTHVHLGPQCATGQT